MSKFKAGLLMTGLVGLMGIAASSGARAQAPPQKKTTVGKVKGWMRGEGGAVNQSAIGGQIIVLPSNDPFCGDLKDAYLHDLDPVTVVWTDNFGEGPDKAESVKYPDKP